MRDVITDGMKKESSSMGMDESGGALDRSVVGECPLCRGEFFSRTHPSFKTGYLKFSCQDCKLAYRIWIDQHSPTEDAILADWALQVPSD